MYDNTRNTNHTNNHNHNNGFKKPRFEAPNWGKLSEKQRMEYLQREIIFIGKKMALPNSDIQHWRRQLTYFMWIPIHVWLTEGATKKEEDPKAFFQSKGVSKTLMEMAERHIPLDQQAALSELRKMYVTITGMIKAYDQRALNNLRVNIGLEPENPQGLVLFNKIFGEEIQERKLA